MKNKLLARMEILITVHDGVITPVVFFEGDEYYRINTSAYAIRDWAMEVGIPDDHAASDLIEFLEDDQILLKGDLIN